MHTMVQTPCFTSSTFLNCDLPEWLSDTQQLALLATDMGLLRVVVHSLSRNFLPGRDAICQPCPSLAYPYHTEGLILPSGMQILPPQSFLVRRGGEKSGGAKRYPCVLLTRGMRDAVRSTSCGVAVGGWRCTVGRCEHQVTTRQQTVEPAYHHQSRIALHPEILKHYQSSLVRCSPRESRTRSRQPPPSSDSAA